MNKLLLFCFVGIFTVNCYFGLEEIEVTLLSDKKINFNGVITIVPHTENVVVWLCNNNHQTLLNLLGNSIMVKKLYFLNDYKGFIIKCGYKMKIDKNDVGLHKITLLANDNSHKIILSYRTQNDREYTNEVLDKLENLGCHIDTEMFIIEDYLDSFCYRNQHYPSLTEQYEMYDL